jgi:type II secretory ATPase GspE/PulE/Tfp pilus assembly ATPase PilB-like protein
MFGKGCGKSGKVRITIEVSETVAAALTLVASRWGKRPEEMAAQLFREALHHHAGYLTNTFPVFDLEDEPPIVRMANAILSSGIDAGAEELLLVPTSDGLKIFTRNGNTEQELMTVPKHIEHPLFARYEVMTRARLSRVSAVAEAAIPIVHNQKPYTIQVGYVTSPDSLDRPESLRLRIEPG